MTSRVRNSLMFTAAAGVALVGSSRSASAASLPPSAVLSGLVNFSNNPPVLGPTGGQIWTTGGSTSLYNLYVTAPNSGLTGAFINTAGGSISQALVPGTTETFKLFGDPGTDAGNFALNLFFDGHTSTPDISVTVPTTEQNSPAVSGFSADTAATSLNLSGQTTLTPLALLNANPLSYTSASGVVVTLTNYSWSNPNVQGLDRVAGFTATPDGAADFTGSFTLSIAAVPEPTTVGLAAVAGLGLLARRRRA